MRAFLLAGGIVAGLTILIATSGLWAEREGKKPEPSRTRIGFFNLTYVLTKYDKAKKYEEEIKGMTVELQQRDSELCSQLKELREKSKNLRALPEKAKKPPAQSREEIEAKIKMIQRKLEQHNEKTKEAIAKRRDQQIRILYSEVSQAATRYARVHDLELILHYNDAITKEEYISTKNFARKLNENALMPVYWKPSMDISIDLVAILNRNLRDHKRGREAP